MYLPSHFRSPSQAAERQLIRQHPLATLVWTDVDGLRATPLPMLLREEGEQLVLAAHLPRANPLVAHLMAGAQRLLAVFNGPEAYISPNWYPGKAETHRRVPTWDYATVHAHGTAEVHDDRDWVRAQLHALTTQQEASQAKPWGLHEAPADYIDTLLKVLVGVELKVTRLGAKFKVSQNHSLADRLGVRAALGEHPIVGLIPAT
jgi:transcriptional regulator